MSTTNDIQTHDIPFSIDWNALDQFIRGIEYDKELNASHNGKSVKDMMDRALDSITVH